MSDTAHITRREADELRRRLDGVDPVGNIGSDYPVPAPGTWAGDLQAEHGRQRRQRLAADKAHAEAQAAALKERADQVAALKVQLAELEAKRAPIRWDHEAAVEELVAPARAGFQRAVAPIDSAISRIRDQIAELAMRPLELDVSADDADEAPGPVRFASRWYKGAK